MEAYLQTLALMNDLKMNDRVKMTVRLKPIAGSWGQRTDKSSANKSKKERIVQKGRF